jgi:hypothetical protein
VTGLEKAIQQLGRPVELTSIIMGLKAKDGMNEYHVWHEEHPSAANQASRSLMPAHLWLKPDTAYVQMTEGGGACRTTELSRYPRGTVEIELNSQTVMSTWAGVCLAGDDQRRDQQGRVSHEGMNWVNRCAQLSYS